MALDEMAATPQTVSPEKSRVRNAASTMKSSLAAVPERSKQAGRAVRSHPRTSTAALAVVGSAVAALVTRRQLKARAAKRTWWQRITRR
jgi:hypothetical protein